MNSGVGEGKGKGKGKGEGGNEPAACGRVV